MKVDVTTELKDFLDQFSGNPLNLKLDLKAKLEELFLDTDTELVYQGKCYLRKDIDYLINDILYEQSNMKEKSNKKMLSIILIIIAGILSGFFAYLSYL